MRDKQSLPLIWLLSDARNDAQLEQALADLPRGSGFVFRHYHLSPEARRARFDTLAALARRRGHAVVLAGTQDWGADGRYGAPSGWGRACASRLRMTAPRSKPRWPRAPTVSSCRRCFPPRRIPGQAHWAAPGFTR